MSATDDAHPPLAVRRTLALLFAALAGAVIGLGAGLLAIPADVPLFEARTAWDATPPDSHEWPRTPHPGESALVEGDRQPQLVVRAPRAPRARELAAAFASQHAGAMRGLLAARDALDRTPPEVAIAPP